MNFSNSRRLKVNLVLVTWSRGLRHPSWESRFWEKVRVPLFFPSRRCWLWRTLPGGVGYAQFSVNGEVVGAHVVSFFLANGYWPEKGNDVAHMCDVRRCVAPHHLFEATRAENIQDMWMKGRASQPPRHAGERHPQAKLTDEQVAELRSKYTGERGQRAALAREYGITKTRVGQLLDRGCRQA